MFYGLNSKPSSTAQQRSQELQYQFPYHYIPTYQPHFGLSRTFGWGINYVSTIEFLLAELGALNFTTVADIGCGDGRFAREISLHFPECTTIGVDYSTHAITLASALNHDRPNLDFQTVDIASQYLIKNIDVVILMEVFEHIPPRECRDFLAGVASTLRPNGVLLLTVPSANLAVTPKHFRHFTSKTLLAELEPYFEIDTMMPFERISIRRKLIGGILSNRLFSLNNARVRDMLYRYYKRTLFHVAQEAQCQRLYVKAVRK